MVLMGSHVTMPGKVKIRMQPLKLGTNQHMMKHYLGEIPRPRKPGIARILPPPIITTTIIIIILIVIVLVITIPFLDRDQKIKG